jgi:hypothetical protein
MAAGVENFDSTSSAALMKLVAGSRSVSMLGDRITAWEEAHGAKDLVLVGELCPEGVSLTPEDGDCSFEAFLDKSHEVRSRVGASGTVIMGRHGHGSMFGLGVQYTEGNDLMRFGSLVRDDVEMEGACTRLVSVADCCMSGGGVAQAWREARLMSRIPANCHWITTGIGFECGPKACGLEIWPSGKVVTAGSGFMRSLARASAFSPTCPLLGLRRVMGARLTSVLCSEGARTRLCDVFAGPRVPQDVTNGLALGWLDMPIQHGGYWVARSDREIASGENVKKYLGSVCLLDRRSCGDDEDTEPLTPESLFSLVAGEIGADGTVAKWERYRRGCGIPKFWGMDATFDALMRRKIWNVRDHLPFFGLVGLKGDAAVASAIEKVFPNDDFDE